MGISFFHQSPPLAAGEGNVRRSQRAGGQRAEDEQQKTAQGSPGKSLTLEGKGTMGLCLGSTSTHRSRQREAWRQIKHHPHPQAAHRGR